MTKPSPKENPIPPWQRISVDAGTAANMLSIGKSTFFARVRVGMYPKARPDGRWLVSELRQAVEGLGKDQQQPAGAQAS